MYCVQITEGCAAGQFDHGASFGRFHCTYRDVVARVYYLKVEGYLYHNEHNQNYLVYIPDRDTEVSVNLFFLPPSLPPSLPPPSLPPSLPSLPPSLLM